jgi:hypothetical protein
MFHDVDETVRAVLQADVPINKAEIDIAFDRPTREWSSRLTKPTLNLFLYDIREREDLKDDAPFVTRDQNGRAVKQTPARRIDLAYFITAWAKEADDEHRILGATLASLYRQGVIDPKHLQGALQGTLYDILTRVTRPDELYNPHDLWGVLDNEHHAVLAWIVTAPLDVFRPVVGPLVRTKEIRVGEFAEAPREGLLQIGGFAYRKGEPLSTLPGVKIAIANTAFEAETDAQGKFTFTDLPAGDYVWRIQSDGGKAKERKVTVPSPSYDIEV